MVTRILLVDNQPLVRQGLRALFQEQRGFEVVGEASDGRAAVQLAQRLLPDVVLMAVSLPDLNGFDATRLIVSSLATTKVIALSLHADHRFVLEMWRAGASGYVPKDCTFGELVKAIRNALGGAMSSGAPEAHPGRDPRLPGPRDGPTGSVFSLLSFREREVLQMLAEGKTVKEIAYVLSRSVKTIETHRTHVMRKVGVHSVAELTRYAIREGLTPLDC
jgi:DNA-binding NarL/FixJ family response regulator